MKSRRSLIRRKIMNMSIAPNRQVDRTVRLVVPTIEKKKKKKKKVRREDRFAHLAELDEHGLMAVMRQSEIPAERSAAAKMVWAKRSKRRRSEVGQLAAETRANNTPRRSRAKESPRSVDEIQRLGLLLENFLREYATSKHYTF